MRAIARHTLPALASLLTVTAAGLLAPPAGAATLPVQAGLTITPTATTVGSTVTVVGTATNTTSATVAASLGIDNKGNGTDGPVHIASVSGSPGCSPRNITKIVYCGIQKLAPGATARITLTLKPASAGSFPFRTYARIMYSPDNSFANGTLTVS